MKKISVYTDGACSGNPGDGGWGALLMWGEHIKELSGHETQTTNNRMELKAVIKALEALRENCEVDLYTDSAYVANAFNEGWLDKWQSNAWRKSDNKAVLNADLWRELLDLTNRHSVQFIKVKGHSDNKYNNRCDELAVGAIKSMRQNAKSEI